SPRRPAEARRRPAHRGFPGAAPVRSSCSCPWARPVPGPPSCPAANADVDGRSEADYVLKDSPSIEHKERAMTKQAKPEGSPWLVPYLVVKDADAALDFYARAFGFAKREALVGDDGKTKHAEMTYKDVLIMFAPEGAYGSPHKCPATLGVASP